MILNAFWNVVIIVIIIALVLLAIKVIIKNDSCSCCDNKCSYCKSNEQLMLVKPSKKHIRQLKKVRKEFLDANSSMDGTSELKKYTNISEWLLKLKNKEKAELLPKDKVPATLFILVRKNDKKIIGFIDVRHYLNDFLLKYGGHIGYSIRPSERNKGYGNRILAEGLKYCKQMGMDKVLVTCIDGNTASERVILNNKGKYESTNYLDTENVYIKRFWINL